MVAQGDSIEVSGTVEDTYGEEYYEEDAPG